MPLRLFWILSESERKPGCEPIWAWVAVPNGLLVSELVQVALHGGRFLAQGMPSGRAAAAHLPPEVLQVPEFEEGGGSVQEDRGLLRPGVDLLPADRDARLEPVEVGVGSEAPDDLLQEPAEVLGTHGDLGPGGWGSPGGAGG